MDDKSSGNGPIAIETPEFTMAQGQFWLTQQLNSAVCNCGIGKKYLRSPASIATRESYDKDVVLIVDSTRV
jgi:hypothetical protein